jgi:hypothetical protein
VTEVFRKLNFKGQHPVLVLSAPSSFLGELRALAKETSVHVSAKAGARYGFLLAFAPMKADLLKAASKAVKVAENDAVLWFAYPKQTSRRFSSDLNRERCWETLKGFSLKPVRQIAIDKDWSALRFTPA